MSQSSATARAATRAVRRETPAQRLRVVPGAAGEPRGGLFAALCIALLAGGLLAVLMLNTALAQGSFVLHDLQSRAGELDDTQEALTQAIDAQRAPGRLAQRARALGMVPADSAAFLRLSDGKILGVARAAGRSAGFAVVVAPVPVAPPKPTTAGPMPTTAGSKPTSAAPSKTVVKKGTLTITTVVSVRPNGEIVTTVTTVDTKSRTTTTKTTVAPAPGHTGTATPTAATPAPSVSPSPQPTTTPTG